MIGWRALQVVAGIAFIACIDLALKATPVRGDEWNAGRLLYAGSGMVTALTLFALAAIGIGPAAAGGAARRDRTPAGAEAARATDLSRVRRRTSPPRCPRYGSLSAT
jgi:hypothetical protein